MDCLYCKAIQTFLENFSIFLLPIFNLLVSRSIFFLLIRFIFSQTMLASTIDFRADLYFYGFFLNSFVLEFQILLFLLKFLFFFLKIGIARFQEIKHFVVFQFLWIFFNLFFRWSSIAWIFVLFCIDFYLFMPISDCYLLRIDLLLLLWWFDMLFLPFAEFLSIFLLYLFIDYGLRFFNNFFVFFILRLLSMTEAC